MHVDILSETTVLFCEAGRYFPGKPHRNTLRRWKKKGANGVKIRVARCGRYLYTSLEEIARFLAAQNAPAPETAPAISNTQRNRRSESAARQLEAAGLR